MQDVVIVGAKRTPIGSFLGSLSSLSASQLGGIAIAGAMQQAGVASVEHAFLGNVLQAGQGQAPARQAVLAAGLPNSVGAVTLHKVCGSGLFSIATAANSIRVQDHNVLIAGGFESMSNAPHLLLKSRQGTRMGDTTLVDSMIKDGLWDPYGNKHMGQCAELCATQYAFSRQEQDAFALQSYQRAQAAIQSGAFQAELVPVMVPQKKGEPVAIAQDEEPFSAPLDKMGSLKPAFDKNGSITAANASKINDGAAALILTSAQHAQSHNLKPLGRIVAQSHFAHEPDWFTTAPITAARHVLKRANMNISQIDLFEINEAFAVVTMAAIRDLELNPAAVNIRGGAIALGHPIGASGARIVITLLQAMIQERKRYGLASICIGGGEASAMIIENLCL